ncbi:MAG: carboxypeptidase-like regulatory domain-containing protein [Acidobacteriia bacterium]|nr:carboxypeptidase-like regulatory domain-containing protein [Terriglobia bacterium]
MHRLQLSFRPRHRGVILLAGLSLLLSFATGFAKDKPPKKDKNTDYALIKGSVFRDDGLSLRGARITCRRATDSKPKWETVSGEGGEFAFRVPIGKMDYIVSAEMKGFQEASKTVSILQDERQDISIILPIKKP